MARNIEKTRETRLLELRLLGLSMPQCVDKMRTEGYRISLRTAWRLWGTSNLDDVIDELVRKQAGDITQLGQFVNAGQDNPEMTPGLKLKALGLRLAFRDRLISKFLGKPDTEINTSVKVTLNPNASQMPEVEASKAKVISTK